MYNFLTLVIMGKKTLDLGQTPIGGLFVEYFVPTLLSLMFSAILNVADGAFVGHGVGSDALAAVNVAAPVFMLATGVGLMMGGGASVVGAIALSHGNRHKASLCATQTLLTSFSVGAVIGVGVLFFPRQLCYVFGGSDVLLPYVTDYLQWLSIAMLCFAPMVAGMFLIRLDGSPRYAMMTNVVPSLLNILLDYLFVFPFGWGIGGAALATSISGFVGVILAFIYFMFFAKDVRLVLPDLRHHLSQTLHDIFTMAKIGAPALIGDFAISFMLIVGNYMFISMLGEDGVAAFSVACYLMPMVFMFANSIAQSSMPIVSYNHGSGRTGRVRQMFRLDVVVAIVTGLLVSLVTVFFGGAMSSVFLDISTPAYALAKEGLPIFALAFVFLTLNIVLIGYLQSIERSKSASIYMFLRGFVFVFVLSLVMPHLFGEIGLWLTVPVSEFLTLVVIVGTAIFRGGVERVRA